MLPLDELKYLDRTAEAATRLAVLKSVYSRLAEIQSQNAADFEIQVAVADVRSKVIDKGVELKRAGADGMARSTAQDGAQSKTTTATAAPPESPAAPAAVSMRFDFRRWVAIVSLVSAAWLIVFVVLVQIARNRNLPPAAPVLPSATKAGPGTVPVDFRTIPPGASIQINGETRCKSDCRIDLLPGNYQVTATMDGFDPGATGVTVVHGGPINVSLSLVSETQTVRLFTDMDGGSAVFDGKPAGELQDGQLVLDRIANGKHSVLVTGRKGAVAFSFEGRSGVQPVITEPAAVTNVLAILVTSLGSQAKVLSSAAGPVKVALNGQPMGEAGPQGLDLKEVPAGAQTLTLGEGRDQRKLVVSFGPMPTVTAFLKSDVSTGTLVVSAGEDDVTVFVNGREYRRKTARGELRIQTVGEVAVRAVKPGFLSEPEQHVEVVKGEEIKVAFHFKPLPKLAALNIRNGVPGTQILIEDRVVGRVGSDGTLSAANLTPGEHAIEARRDGFITRRILRSLRAGDTLVLSGSDIALTEATGSVHLVLSPPDAVVTYRRTDETTSHSARDASVRLEPGSYVFTARAANFMERTERVTIVAGEARKVELSLERERKPPAAAATPASAPSGINWAGWEKEGSEYVRRGGSRVVVKSGALAGTITFTAHLRKAGGIFRGGKLRWFVEDGDGYSQFEVDKKRFQAKGPDGSRSKDHSRGRSEEDSPKSYTIQIEITPDRIVHRMKVGAGWVTLDTQPNGGVTEGKFGFVIPGNDEIAVSDVRFSSR